MEKAPNAIDNYSVLVYNMIRMIYIYIYIYAINNIIFKSLETMEDIV